MNKGIDYLLLMGGTDINSELYGEKPLPTTDKPDEYRDLSEFNSVMGAIEQNIPVIGICRGAQLLCAINWGKLHQHVPEHRNNNHPLFCRTSEIDADGIVEYVVIEHVAADHHQCMIPMGNYKLFAYAGDNNPEVVYWPETKCLAVQPHPEWMNKDHPFNIWLDSLIFNLFNLKVEF
jgi:putative glutamine amidotransferase